MTQELSLIVAKCWFSQLCCSSTLHGLVLEELPLLCLYYFLTRTKEKALKKKERSGYHFNWSVVSSHSPLVCWVQLLCDLDLHFWGYSDGGLSPHKFKAHLLLCCAVGSCRYSKMTLQSLLFGSKILLCFHPYPTFMLNLWITKIFILMFPKLNVL